MASQIQLRRGSAAQWTSANPILSEGEIGYETDTGKLKIGDGSSDWSALGYSFDVPDLSTQSIDALSDVDTASTAPTDGQVLLWNDTAGQWEPGAVSGSTPLLESQVADTSSSGTVTFDLDDGNVFTSTLTESTTVAFVNPPASGTAQGFTIVFTQDATGGRTVTWPASVKWAGGTAPTITATASATDVVTLITYDGGTTYYGFLAGQDFS